MEPRTPLTSVPYALKAKSLALPYDASYSGPGGSVFSIERTFAGHAIVGTINTGNPSAGSGLFGRAMDRGYGSNGDELWSIWTGRIVYDSKRKQSWFSPFWFN